MRVTLECQNGGGSAFMREKSLTENARGSEGGVNLRKSEWIKFLCFLGLEGNMDWAYGLFWASCFFLYFAFCFWDLGQIIYLLSYILIRSKTLPS